MPQLIDTSSLPIAVTQALIGASYSVTLKPRIDTLEFGMSLTDVASLIDNRLPCRCLLPLPGIHRNRGGSLHRDAENHSAALSESTNLATQFADLGWDVRLAPQDAMITTSLIVDDETAFVYSYLNDVPGPLYATEREVAHYVEQFETYWRQSYDSHERIYHAAAFASTCQLIVPDFEQINLELMAYFAEHPDHLNELHWRKFEELLDAIFKNQGYHTELGPGSGDGGVDLRLVQKDSVGELITLVQAKRYNKQNPIGLEAVQALHGVVDDQRAHRGLFVTTSRYLPGAQQFAERQNQRLILATSAEVAQWCRKVVTQ